MNKVKESGFFEMKKDIFNLDSDLVQTQALKDCGYSKNQIEIYLRAKHNYYDVHYAFYDVNGWLDIYIDDIKADFYTTDLDDVGNIGEKEFINNKLINEFGTSEQKKIVEKIMNGDIFADQLGGRWCDVSGNKIWVSEG